MYDNFFNFKKISKSVDDFNLNEFNIIKKMK